MDEVGVTRFLVYRSIASNVIFSLRMSAPTGAVDAADKVDEISRHALLPPTQNHRKMELMDLRGNKVRDILALEIESVLRGGLIPKVLPTTRTTGFLYGFPSGQYHLRL